MIYVTSRGMTIYAIIGGAVKLTARKMFRRSSLKGFGIETLVTRDGEKVLKIINKKARRELRAVKNNHTNKYYEV